MSAQGKKKLIEKENLHQHLIKALKSYRAESSIVRPPDNRNLPGGLIILKENIPTILVPDLHGRHYFLEKVLNWIWKGKTVVQHLKQGEMQLVCVGDGMHSERTADLWREAFEEYQGKYKKHFAMDTEMLNNLSTLYLILDLKIKFPDHFHFLKGNHENIMNENDNGNHSFCKYAYEGAMVLYYMEKFYGSEIVSLIDQIEKSFPLLAVGGKFIVSHAQPKEAYSKEEIINYRIHPDVVEGMTWTGNGQSEEGSVRKMSKTFLPIEHKKIFWFAGHRPVKNFYNFIDSERFVQIHNPLYQAITLISPDKEFSLEEDIFQVQ